MAIHGALIAAFVFQPAPKAGPSVEQDRGLLVFDLASSSISAAHTAESDEHVEEAVNEQPMVVETTSAEQAHLLTQAPAVSTPEPEDAGSPAKGSEGASQPSVAEGATRSNYQQTLFNHVMQYRYYPEAARPDRLRGLVRIQFALARDGRIRTVWIERSSGFSIIDEAAMETLRRAQPMPRIPAELPDEIEVLLPLEYLPPQQLRAG